MSFSTTISLLLPSLLFTISSGFSPTLTHTVSWKQWRNSSAELAGQGSSSQKPPAVPASGNPATPSALLMEFGMRKEGMEGFTFLFHPPNPVSTPPLAVTSCPAGSSGGRKRNKVRIGAFSSPQDRLGLEEQVGGWEGPWTSAERQQGPAGAAQPCRNSSRAQGELQLWGNNSTGAWRQMPGLSNSSFHSQTLPEPRAEYTNCS